MIRISIITPSLNQGRFVGDALESVRAQKYENTEHLVYDGGSNDETLGILTSRDNRPEWKYLRWQSEPDAGQSAALNRGFDAASGEIVGWLNADDRYVPGCFAHVARAFAEDPTLDVLYGDLTEINEWGKLRRVRREIGFSRFILLYHHVLYIPTATTFYRRKVFEDGNRLRPDLHYAMDYEFFIRLAEKGYRIRHTPRVLAEFRVHAKSKSCSMAAAQADEKLQILRALSPVAKRLKAPMVRDAVLFALSIVAAVMRRARKAIPRAYFGSRESWFRERRGEA